ncbi:Pre-rRNA-processing protein TSR2 [Macleaya cordata]|uniref:Pre-rRNA-processing protein TSR2 n=1 Tax=Macleaya cordata TaxID=56857 RepID=A0A200QYG6_MACCD|nr:Pre-rRNA-processing protein TSR2 [Macleaya cordata]
MLRSFMDSNNGRHVTSQQLRPESLSIFAEGISLLLSRWSGLQLAIKNEWGGRDSRQKSEQLASDLFYWFSQSKGSIKDFTGF